MRCGVEEAFGAEEVAGSGAFVEGEAEGLNEGVRGVVVLGGVVLKIAVAAFGAEAVVSGDGFEEGGFAAAVFSGEEDDAGVEV